MHSDSATRVALITGATSGIGAAIAAELSGAGYALVLTGRSEIELDKLAHSLPGPSATVAGDLRDESLPGRLVAAAVEQFGGCDVCVNNGGILETGTIESIDVERVCEMVRVNVEAAFRIAYVFLKHCVKQGRGHLINTSSVLGRKVRPTAGGYAGTKWAIEALSEALRMELSKTEIQVSAIEPGLVKTHLHDRWEKPPGELLGIAEPLQPADVARVVRFILEQPPHVRIPQMMILPRGQEI
jgi:NADP-dependent 3-hydroxy acid dehydrogenase YdfG